MKVPTPEDESAAYQVVCGVKDHIAVDGYGPERGSPEMDSETLVQALRGAAGAKTVQCAKARHGEPECLD